MLKFVCASASLVLLGLFMPVQAFAADWEGVFEGTIGKAKVLVELNAGADSAYKTQTSGEGPSRYSYQGKAYDLTLIPFGTGGHLRFSETPETAYAAEELDPGDARFTGSWFLDVNDKGAEGTWTSPKGKKLPIVLSRLPLLPSASGLPELGQLSASYDLYWVDKDTISGRESVQDFDGIKVALARDQVFRIGYPVFESYPDAQHMQAINDMLRREHREAIARYRACINGVTLEQRTDPPDGQHEADFTIEIVYADARLLSFVDSGSVYCGGAHPINYANPVTFDLVVLKQIGGGADDLAADAFGSIFKLAPGLERAAFDAFAWGKWMENAARFPEDEAQCASGGFENDKKAGERLYSLSFTKAGLAVRRTDYPHVASTCLWQPFNPTVIPWAELKPFLKPGQSLVQPPG